MDRPRPGADQAAAFVARQQGKTVQPDHRQGFAQLGATPGTGSERKPGFRALPAATASPGSGGDLIKAEGTTGHGEKQASDNGRPAHDIFSPRTAATEGSSAGDSPKRSSGETAEHTDTGASAQPDGMAPDHGGKGSEPPNNNTPADGPERLPNPRGVKLMAPLTLLEDTDVNELDPHARDATNAMVTVLREAKDSGIEVIDTSNMRSGVRVAKAQSGETYDTMPFGGFSITRELELAERLARRGELNVPQVRYFLDTSSDDMQEMLELEGGFILARIDMDRGEGKYLIDRPDQVDTLARAAQDGNNRGLLDRLVIKEFIPTPTERYTSLKVYTNPKAEPIAATLTYSHHTKDDQRHRVVSMPNPRGSSDPTRVLFEDPASPGYLRAKDPVSLSDGGFGQIALMGPYAGRLQPGEAQILVAHGIDPAHPAVPDEISTQVKGLQPLTRLAGLVSSSDFLVNAYTGEPYYLETNSGPGPSPVAVCWLGTPQHPDRYEEMYRLSIKSLAGV